MKSPLISIIILNWNGKEMTEECLNSLLPQITTSFEVIVVDNGSTDGSLEYLKKKFPFIKLIKNKENLGYAGGNNLGVKNAKGNYVLILNNDIVLDNNFLKEILKHKNKADILGVKNYYYDKKNTIWAIGSKLNNWIMKSSLVGNKKEDKGQLDKIKVDYIVGSAMLINKKVIDKIGFLNAEYFAYCEETEWQIRAKNAGFKTSWIPTAKLWHKVGFSTGGGRTPLSAYYLIRNRAYLIKNFSKHKLISWLFWILEVKLRIFYGLIKNRKYAKTSCLGMMDFFKGVKGKRIFKKSFNLSM